MTEVFRLRRRGKIGWRTFTAPELVTVKLLPPTKRSNHGFGASWGVVELTTKFYVPRPEFHDEIDEWCAENLGRCSVQRPARPANRVSCGVYRYGFENKEDAAVFAVWLKLVIKYD